MIKIPFYHHYYDPSKNSNETGNAVRNLFKVIGIGVKELPCLCQYPDTLKINLPVALVHGRRGKDEKCYKQIYEQMQANPDTSFYLWAINVQLDEGVSEFLRDGRRPLNCKPIFLDNLTQTMDELRSHIGRTAK